MFKKNKTFVDLCLEGRVMLEQIDDFIDQWHDGDSEESLYEYLGLTRNEYAIFVENPNSLSSILMSRRFKGRGENVTVQVNLRSSASCSIS